MDIQTLHQRYLQQAGWTRPLRLHLYRTLEAARRARILDLGCGTGVIAAELAQRTLAEVHAVDKDPALIDYARNEHQGLNIQWHVANAGSMPFPKGHFDLIVTHYFWLWVASPMPSSLSLPLAVLKECRWILKDNGRIAALCEPDYGARIDEPREMSAVYSRIRRSLIAQGADPDIGPKLPEIFEHAGLRTESGKTEIGWDNERHRAEFDSEWEFIESMPSDDPAHYKEIERHAIEQGTRSSRMPVHWCIGRPRR